MKKVSPAVPAAERKAAAPPRVHLGKPARDVFTKGYGFGLIKLDLKTKSENGLEFTSSGSANTETAKVTGAWKPGAGACARPRSAEQRSPDGARRGDGRARSACTRTEADLRFVLLAKHWGERS